MAHRNSVVHVAVGVVRDAAGRILIAQRAQHAHQGGLWEFPGGKLEPGEPVLQALVRELREEVGIRVAAAEPLIKIHHDYGDRRVLLDVWNVNSFSGEARPCEGQAMQWVNAGQLSDFAFPAANLPIIAAARLPAYYAILEGPDAESIMTNCQRIIDNGVKLLQFRAKALAASDKQNVLEQVLQQCRQHAVEVLVNADLDLDISQAQGLHLSSRALLRLDRRPAGMRWVAASCHNAVELQHALAIGADFAVLAPVMPTASHPDTPPLGWQRFSELLESANLPVFALGGLGRQDLALAQTAGAQGIAGISAFLV
ncbi:Nudix family hydrolase [Methylomonas koyamae]|uniref:8-oxo-dGTP diphosphatase n=1 Tax=Methylomonas koyamae TaxID=702114 RepID=A0AA91DBV8_9GAMM|nr:Nudix family hydrolase [Methylomonas koyamae]OAI24368.1 DNA mismatch repair protein MutT [Methylomonas koyamae]